MVLAQIGSGVVWGIFQGGAKGGFQGCRSWGTKMKAEESLFWAFVNHFAEAVGVVSDVLLIC